MDQQQQQSLLPDSNHTCLYYRTLTTPKEITSKNSNPPSQNPANKLTSETLSPLTRPLRHPIRHSRLRLLHLPLPGYAQKLVKLPRRRPCLRKKELLELGIHVQARKSPGQ